MEEINVWTDMAMNILLAIIGLAIYSLIKAGKFLNHWSWSIFFNKNKAFWVWALCLQVIFALLLAVAPEAASAIKTMIGIDYSESMAFVTSGGVLAAIANSASKVGHKKTS